MTGPSIRIVGYEFQAYFHQGLVVALMIVNARLNGGAGARREIKPSHACQFRQCLIAPATPGEEPGKLLLSIYALAASLSTIRRTSASGIANSAKPQFKQTRSFGKTHTIGLSSPSSPGK